MKKILRLSLPILSTLLLLGSLYAQEPVRLVPFQANLTDKDNKPVPNAVYNIRFQLYNAPTGGIAMWSEYHTNVNVVHGQISILLGYSTPFPADINFTANRYLGVKIDNNVEMIPRFQLIPSFHAVSTLYSKTAENTNSAELATKATLAMSAGLSITADHTKIAGSASNASNAKHSMNTNKLADQLPEFYVKANELSALNDRINALEGRYVPAGTVLAHSSETVPLGFFECNGQELSKNTYEDLYFAIGGRYGETASNFRLPDYRGQFLRGWNDGKDDGTAPDEDLRTDSAVGAIGGLTGDHVGTRQTDGLAPHQHSFVTGKQSQDHRHPETGMYSTLQMQYANIHPTILNVWMNSVSTTTGGVNQNHTHDATTDMLDSLETRPVNKTVMYIIKH